MVLNFQTELSNEDTLAVMIIQQEYFPENVALEILELVT